VIAELVVVFHFAFVLYVVLGGLLVVRWPRTAWLHLPAVIWGIWIELSGRICPLTPLENSLRSRAGEATYQESFIEHYMLPVLYPSGLTRKIQMVLAGVVLLINLAFYGLAVRRNRVMERIPRRNT
jgi:hypothetical protein